VSATDLYHEILIAGFGGQGVVLAGNLLAKAALAEGREVVWAPSYGPEMRGGAVHCTVIVSSQRIGSPEVSLADSLLIMDAASLQRFSSRMKPDGLLVLNTSLVAPPPSLDSFSLVEVPANDVAEDLGDVRVANVIMLGAFLEARPVVTPDSVVKAMQLLAAGRPAESLVDINREALSRGAALAK
jgi:2-oxoglutarate ferredoxin oxidoreductase subunit gamma